MKKTFVSKPLVAKEFAAMADSFYLDDKAFSEVSEMLDSLMSAGASDGLFERKVMAPGIEEGREVELYVYRPDEVAEVPMPLIYYMHGSGYLVGRANMYATLFKKLANTHRATVITVEYRLATEAPFPADLNDAYAGLCYCYDHAEELGIDASRMVIMGESAGGGLSARVALYNRDHRNLPLRGQVLVYPMLDCRTGTDADLYKNRYAGEMVWTREFNRTGWTTLLGGQQLGQEQLPYFSAALATDLSGLPQTFIMVGTLDLFVNEDVDYANRLIQAGVTTQLLTIPGVFHGFDMLGDTPPQVRLFHTVRDEAIQRMLAE